MRITSANIQDVFKSEKASLETLELKGYKLIQEFFVDNSGLESERGLITSFVSGVEKILVDNPSIYSFITNCGQFQVYVGIFKKVKRSAEGVKKIAPNTLRIENEGGYSIRLYDTDIISVNLQNNTCILNSGGFNTVTTRARISQFLPCDGSFYQKKGKWYIDKKEVKENESFSIA